MWRPDDWEEYKEWYADKFEAGADAMLRALRKKGAYYGEVDFWRGQHHYWTGTGKAGHWVFIPEEEERGKDGE